MTCSIVEPEKATAGEGQAPSADGVGEPTGGKPGEGAGSAEGEGDTNDDGPSGGGDGDGSTETDPEVARLSRALQEEREAREELTSKLSEAKTAEEFAAVQTRVDELELERDRREVARAAELPPEWEDRVRGATREEMEADAEALREMIPSASADTGSLRGGVRGDFLDEEAFDPAEVARSMRKRRY